jgi:non-ribosomal peptide synthetase component F
MIIQDLGASLRLTQATHVFATPALWSLLDAAPSELPDLKVVALGGERIPREVMDLWGPSKRLINTYGVTEATICQTAIDIADGSHPAGSVGQPLPGVLTRLSPAGELLLGGPQLARGYLNRPDLDAERFVSAEAAGLSPGDDDAPAALWLRTGDLARLADDGSIEIVGRMDDQVGTLALGVSAVLGRGRVWPAALPLCPSCAHTVRPKRPP